MKVYTYFFFLACLMMSIAGCSSEKDSVQYTIENSGGALISSGSISGINSLNIAYINELSGSVLLDETRAKQGDIIRENSILTTGTASEVEVIFTDSSIIRLLENSRLQISKKGIDDTALHLQEGTLWTRILKPFTDASFFTLETDDLSAGVRGTSVWLITNSGGTDIGVVDSTTSSGGTTGVDIKIQYKQYSGSGDITLKSEDTLSIRHNKNPRYQKIKLGEQIRLYPFIRTHTIRDIRYMYKLMNSTGSHIQNIDRIQEEIRTTLPTSDEMILFFTDSTIKSELSNTTLTPEQFIRYLDLEGKMPENQEPPEKNTLTTTPKETTRTPNPLPKTPIKSISPSPTISGEIRKTTNCIQGISGEICR